MSTLIRWMEDRDANEERRYLIEGKRWNLDWSWLWLAWSLGINVSRYPSDSEPFSAWVSIGPLTVEVYRTRGGGGS